MMNDELTVLQNPQARKFISGVLVLLILLGITLRFIGLNWDSGHHLHPDERFLTMTATALQWPHSLSNYFATDEASLNPFLHGAEFFVYGQLPLVLVKAVATLLHRDNFNDLVLVGRFLAALFDSATVLLVFFVGQKLGSRLLGLLAAAFLSLTPLHIQHAHFLVVDTFAVTFLVASFYFALIAFQSSDFDSRSSLLTGCCFGVACACKFSSVFFGIVLFTALLWRCRGAARCAPTTVLSAILTFRILHPIAFRGEGGVLTLWGLLDVRLHPQFWSSLMQQAKITSGEIDVPFNIQWVGRTDYLWPLCNLGNWAVGWPLLLSGIAAILVIAIQLLRRRAVERGITIAVLWVLFVFAFYGGQFSKFTRYYLIITPFIALLAAWFLLQIKPRPIKIVAVTGVLGWSLLWSLAVASIYAREHPRVATTKWMLEYIPAGTTIVNESAWDDALPLRDAAQYRLLDLKLFDTDDANKRAHLLNVLNQTEWICISSQRGWQSIPRLPQRWPLMTEYYRVLFNKRLGFEPVKEFASYPHILGWEFSDENVEEALTVYDHPKVVLFRKTPEYSSAHTAALLNEKLLRNVDRRSLYEIIESKPIVNEKELPRLPSQESD